MTCSRIGFGSRTAASRPTSSSSKGRGSLRDRGPAGSDRDVEHVLEQMPVELTLDEVKAAIALLPREERANLRPWILARYDVRGYPVRGYVEQPRPAADESPR